MSSVLDISSLYDSYSTQTSGLSADSVSSQISSVGEDSSDEELLEACQSFESYFVQKMIEEAKKTLDNEDEQGEYTKMFADMKNEQLADTITESGQLGLAQQLYDNIKSQYNL
jgi:flagellar protein FlgJ